MQTILKKLLQTVQLPMMELPKGALIKPEDFERVGPGGITQAEYTDFKSLVKALPRKKNMLVKTLEEKLQYECQKLDFQGMRDYVVAHITNFANGQKPMEIGTLGDGHEYRESGCRERSQQGWHEDQWYEEEQGGEIKTKVKEKANPKEF